MEIHVSFKAFIPLVMAGLLSVACMASKPAGQVQQTYLGPLEYQDQTLTKTSAEFLHRQILL